MRQVTFLAQEPYSSAVLLCFTRYKGRLKPLFTPSSLTHKPQRHTLPLAPIVLLKLITCLALSAKNDVVTSVAYGKCQCNLDWNEFSILRPLVTSSPSRSTTPTRSKTTAPRHVRIASLIIPFPTNRVTKAIAAKTATNTSGPTYFGAVTHHSFSGDWLIVFISFWHSIVGELVNCVIICQRIPQ